jgi:hypothetical protein
VGYADDLTIFVESDTELQKALCIIENFETGSGLAVNREKSEILELGIKSTTMGIHLLLQQQHVQRNEARNYKWEMDIFGE